MISAMQIENQWAQNRDFSNCEHALAT